MVPKENFPIKSCYKHCILLLLSLLLILKLPVDMKIYLFYFFENLIKIKKFFRSVVLRKTNNFFFLSPYTTFNFKM